MAGKHIVFCVCFLANHLEERLPFNEHVHGNSVRGQLNPKHNASPQTVPGLRRGKHAGLKPKDFLRDANERGGAMDKMGTQKDG